MSQEYNRDEWLAVVNSINDYNLRIFPKIFLQKPNNMNFHCVKEDFPILDDFEPTENVMKTMYNSLCYYSVFQTKIQENQEKTRDEESAITILESCHDLILIAWKRWKVNESYEAVQKSVDVLISVRYTNRVLLAEIEFKNGGDQDKLEDLLQFYRDYQEAKGWYDRSIDSFKDNSKALAKLEKLPFNDAFNKNFYLNYHQTLKEIVLDDVSLKDFVLQQEKEWANMLRSLDVQNRDETEGHDHKDENKKEDDYIQKKFKKAFDQFQKVCTEAQESINSVTIIELNIYLEDIKRLRSSIKDLENADEVEISEEQKAFIDGSKATITLLYKKTEELNKQAFTQRELEKLKLQGDVRSMETVKLKPLNGFHDFLSWKICMKSLNKHQDPFKRAAALLGTLNNQQDKDRCEGIYDYDELMRILNHKYSHQELLTPALINKLKALPIAYQNETMLQNIGTILNILKQLKLLSKTALQRFDLSVIEDLTRKLTLKAQEEWEHHWYEFNSKIDAASDLDSSEAESEPPDGDELSVISGETKLKDKAPLESDLTTAKKRKCFIRFLKVKERILMSVNARNNMLYGAVPKPKCKYCHKSREKCVCKRRTEKLYTVDQDPERTGNVCPCCNKKVQHFTKAGKPTKSIARCPNFMKQSVDEKLKTAKRLKACLICLNTNHLKTDCRLDSPCIKCKKEHHHHSLCKEPPSNQDQEEEVHATEMESEIQPSKQFHGMISGKVLDCKKTIQRIKLLFDQASTGNFITRKSAKRLGLKGETAFMKLSTVNKDAPRLKTKRYTLKLVTESGEYVEIIAFELDKIGKTKEHIDQNTLTNLGNIFKIEANQIANCGGNVELLIGLKDLDLFPTYITKHEKLRLYNCETISPKKYMVLGSTTPNVSDQEVHLESQHLSADIRSFMLNDSLGLEKIPQCPQCQKTSSCKECKRLVTPMSYKEAADAELCKKSISFDQDAKETRVEYQYKGDVDKIFHRSKTNEPLATKMATRLLKDLKNDNKHVEYTKQFLDMESRKVMREITPEEDAAWKGPINYCSHHPVIKESSSTTRCRPVCNSSLPHNGTTLNNLLPKPPKSITNLLSVLHRFRAKSYCLITDIKKAYNSIKTSLKDFHLRRFVWMREDQLESPTPKLTTWGMETMAFGDTPASYYLELAKQKIAEYTTDTLKEPKLGKEIVESSYVDDITISEDDPDTINKYKEVLPIGFGEFGFSFKDIFTGGSGVKQPDTDESKINLFGHIYDKSTDEFIIKFHANFSAKKRNAYTQKNLTMADDLRQLKINKRKILGLISQQYDPIGFCSPFIGKIKLFLKKLFKDPAYTSWDTPLNEEDTKTGRKLIEEILKAEAANIRFSRSVKPPGYKLKAIACFVDASAEALMCVVYGIYVNEHGEIHVALITSKQKVISHSIPRNELCGMLAGHRAVYNYLESSDEKPETIFYFTDSSCTLDFLRENYVAKEVFVINRVFEIIKLRKKINIQTKYVHIPTKENIADNGTRPDVSFQFLQSQEWKHGPDMLRHYDSIIPDIIVEKDEEATESHFLYSVQMTEENCPWSKLMKNTNNIYKVMRTYCILKAIFKNKSFKMKNVEYDYEKAYKFFVQITQEKYELEEMNTKQLKTFKDKDDNIVYTKMRFPDELMSNVFNKQKLPVLPGKSRLAKLVIQNAHKSNTGLINANASHNGKKNTLVNTRIGLFASYITYAKNCIKGVINSCSVCRKLQKIPTEAVMADRKHAFNIPPEPSEASAFQSISIDYFGPFICKQPNSRTTRATRHSKVYGMAILDNISRAVNFIPVESYNTESFITAFRIHVNQFGVPSEITSDPMSAFLKASKELDADISAKTLENSNEFESNLIKKYAMKWNFIPPGSQWRNPAERTIKSLKELLTTMFNSYHDAKPVLTMNEYWLLFTDISEQLNRRPIQGFLDNDDLQFITPNHLLIGRATKSKETQISTKDVFERLELINSIKAKFWNEIQSILIRDHRLFKTPKWYKQERKPAINDIVLVLYKQKVHDQYRIGKITHVSEDGRNLEVKVSPIQNGSIDKLKPAVLMKIPTQRTCLLYTKEFEE